MSESQYRRLTGTNFSAQQADAQIDDTKYSYDPVGNLTKMVNTQGREGQSPVRTQCFTYDTLNRTNTSLIPLKGKEIKDVSQYLVEDILTNPRTAMQSWTHPTHGAVYDFWLEDVGARWSQNGDFIGFLDH
ncbi:hypothetical protein [Lentzea sp. NPDC004782]|uniref:hypothetical protein n=1 Tax=Lentzea sp. NPDC004782 TaxID=3154458 RepID=UPI0033BB5A8D